VAPGPRAAQVIYNMEPYRTRDRFEHLGVDMRIILKINLIIRERGSEGVNWIYLAHDKN
jgi:hypothetical protein